MTWVVDASNVIGSRPDGWWRDRAGAARRLVGQLDAFAAETGEPVIVVLDSGAPPPAEHAEVVVASRKGRNAADDEIVALLEDRGADGVRVVTSDAELARRVRALGADVEGAGGFRRRLGNPGSPGTGNRRSLRAASLRASARHTSRRRRRRRSRIAARSARMRARGSRLEMHDAVVGHAEADPLVDLVGAGFSTSVNSTTRSPLARARRRARRRDRAAEPEPALIGWGVDAVDARDPRCCGRAERERGRGARLVLHSQSIPFAISASTPLLHPLRQVELLAEGVEPPHREGEVVRRPPRAAGCDGSGGSSSPSANSRSWSHVLAWSSVLAVHAAAKRSTVSTSPLTPGTSAPYSAAPAPARRRPGRLTAGGRTAVCG